MPSTLMDKATHNTDEQTAWVIKIRTKVAYEAEEQQARLILILVIVGFDTRKTKRYTIRLHGKF